MIRLLWAISITVRRFLRRYMPTNIFLDWIRTRQGLRWGVPAMLLVIPYVALACLVGSTIKSGGPGWLNIVVMLGIWNAFKMLSIGPASLFMLLRARARERREGA